ncbi:MAG TPA: DUF4129 domain-containing protein [Candidatus Sulfotelmatobacter sp.]|nr:DUF4129 domain-containing protein [Candidatus Sulfotelmatobacter sp.]
MNSYWLIYFLSLAPLIGLGLIVALIIYLGYNWRLVSDAIGFGVARKRSQNRKKFKTLPIIITLAVWALAIEFLVFKCNGLICKANPNATVTLSTQITNSTSGPEAAASFPFLSSIAQFSSLIQLNWFIYAVIGLVFVCSVIVVRSILVSWDETRSELISKMPLPLPEGIDAVEAAIHILKTQTDLDPRMRIINSYQSMVERAKGVGASVTSDQTARELEAALRIMLRVNSPAIRELTDLFEEARYSLHPITEDDAGHAQRCLLDISRQMDLRLNVMKIET